uniref:Saposin B-type domain-containing protein n=1 Tax=Panagrolaimus superbus TaxID=310955 RepID=A0A914Z903_9BILA
MKFFGILLIFLVFWSSSFAAPVEHKLESASCNSCNLIVEVAHDVLGDDALDDCIVDFISWICSALKIEDHFVCKGMVGDFKEQFIYVLQELIVEPKEICGLLVKGCDGGFDPYNATWFLPMPGVKPPHKTPTPIPSGKPTLRVLHLSDLHVDNDYIIGSEAKCDEPLCCRPPKDTNEAFVQKKDIAVPAGKWGTVGDCDAPYWLLEDMMKDIAANHKDITVIHSRLIMF